MAFFTVQYKWSLLGHPIPLDVGSDAALFWNASDDGPEFTSVDW